MLGFSHDEHQEPQGRDTMKTSSIRTDTVYEISKAVYPDMILSLIPYQREMDGYRVDRLGFPELAPDPDGHGFGRDRVCHSARGLLALTAHGFGELSDDRIAGLPDVASKAFAHIKATSMWLYDLPEGYALHLVRPSDVIRTWAERLELDAAEAAAQEECVRQAAERKVKLVAARDQLHLIFGECSVIGRGQWESYSTTLEMDWIQLKQLCELYASSS